MPESCFVFYHINVQDGESEYSYSEIAEIIGGKGLTAEEIAETLNEKLKSFFDDDGELDEDKKVWNFDLTKYADIDGIRVIPKEDYVILSKYLYMERIRPKVKPFRFR